MRRTRTRRALVVAGLLGIGLALGAPAAMAADATGCSGSATSFAADKSVVDQVNAPGAGGTQDTPFKIDVNGTVDWKGQVAGTITNGTWSVNVAGIPVSGTYDSASGAKSGTVEIPMILKMTLQGKQKVPVTVSINGSGGNCSATIWIQGNQSPMGSPMWIAGTVLLAASLFFFVAMILTTTAQAAPAAGAGGGAATGGIR